MCDETTSTIETSEVNDETTNSTQITNQEEVLTRFAEFGQFAGQLAELAAMSVLLAPKALSDHLTGSVSVRTSETTHTHDVYEIRSGEENRLIRVTVESWPNANEAPEIQFD